MSKLSRTPLVVVALVLGAALAPATATAAPALRWSALGTFDAGGGTPSAVSCASESLCVAVDEAGDAFSTSNPTASSPLWSRAQADPGEALSAVSCAPSGLCVAVDRHGHAVVNGIRASRRGRRRSACPSRAPR